MVVFFLVHVINDVFFLAPPSSPEIYSLDYDVPLSPLPPSPVPPTAVLSRPVSSNTLFSSLESTDSNDGFSEEEKIRCAAFDEDLMFGDAIAFLRAEQTPNGIHRMFEYYENIFNLCKKRRPVRGRHQLSIPCKVLKALPYDLAGWKKHFNYRGSSNSLDDIYYYKYVAGAIRHYHDMFDTPISWKCIHFYAYKIVVDSLPALTDDRESFMVVGDQDECVVCFFNTVWKTSCNHQLCRKCENKISKCPICQRPFKNFQMQNYAVYRRILDFCKSILNNCQCQPMYNM